MATKAPVKQATEQSAATDVELEAMIADELLDSIDWQLVRRHLLSKVRSKFYSLIFTHDSPALLPPESQLLTGEVTS